MDNFVDMARSVIQIHSLIKTHKDEFSCDIPNVYVAASGCSKILCLFFLFTIEQIQH
jgi:hypothetical protein